MLVRLLGMVTLVRLVQPQNAPLPKLVTLLGMITLVRLAQYSNAHSDAGDAVGDRNAGQTGAIPERLDPMLVTLLGMVTLVRLVPRTHNLRCW